MSQYKYAVIDEFGGVMRKFASKIETQPYLTPGAKLVRLPTQPKKDPYTMACNLLQEALLWLYSAQLSAFSLGMV